MKTSRLLVLITVIMLFAISIPLGHTAASQAGQPLVIGVIGSIDGPTARGLQVAAMRLNANGPFNISGKAYSVTISAKEAATVEELQAAVDEFKTLGAVAIFGPDDDALAKAGFDVLSAAEIPVFIGATDPAIVPAGTVFRTRANENIQMNALVEAIATDLKQTKIVVYQGSEEYAAKGSAFTLALAKRSITPASVLIQTTDIAIAEVATAIIGTTPEAVLALADPKQVAELYLALRADGYTGTFATNAIEDPAFVETLPEANRSSLFGVTNWTSGSIRKDSIDFTTDYQQMFTDKPQGLSAAAYDSAVAIVIAYRRAGLNPAAAIATLLKFPPADSIQGTFNATLGNNELSANANVITTGEDGAPGIFVRFNGDLRLLGEDVQPTPTPSRTPTETPLPTATPDGVVATVTASTSLNVRNGPGFEFDKIGSLKKGDQVRVLGANADFTWLLIPFRGGQAWILAEFTSIFGDKSTVPIVAGPPQPTSQVSTATATPVQAAKPDIVYINAVFTPSNLQPNVPFTLAVTIANRGSVPAGEFAIAATFKPGDVYTAAVVPGGLGAAQQATVNLSATVPGTGVEQIAVVLDLNNTVDEGPEGEANNQPVVNYRVDRPYAAQSSATLAPNTNFDLDGGGDDVIFTGTSMDPTGQSAIALLPVQFTQVHYDFLAQTMGSAALGTQPVGGPPAPGTVIGVRTNQGKFAVIQVVGYAGNSIQFNYYVY
ncbi:MAG: ABC transporter substrate-binding protein [Anaerolineae bacterium]|nr:ABC transporter substrate-binding protein [Anaerolineae bacterium]